MHVKAGAPWRHDQHKIIASVWGYLHMHCWLHLLADMSSTMIGVMLTGLLIYAPVHLLAFLVQGVQLQPCLT